MVAPPLDDPPRLLEARGDLLALYKPAGVAVHPTHDPRIPDLMTWAGQHLGLPDLSPIHRLDRETSGLVLASADPALRGRLGALFAQSLVQKTYQALVFGHPRPEGTIRKPLPDARRGRPLEATTRYTVLEALPGCALLQLHPDTGRKHQLRRHLQAIGFPIIGDTRYPPRRPRRVHAFPGRLWLHALTLLLPDQPPFTAPLPSPLERHLQALRRLQTDAAPDPEHDA